MTERVFLGNLVVLADKDTGAPYNAGSPAAGATSIAKAEDAVHASGDVGTMALAVRRDTASASAADGDYIPLIVDANGGLWLAPLATGTNLIGRAVADASAATGGIASTSRIVSAAADTNATSAKASAGRLYFAFGYNAAAAVRYLKFYNKASAPTVGTDTPVLTLALPPSSAFAFDWPLGFSFATGIAYGMVTAAADNSTAALTAADVVGLNVGYV